MVKREHEINKISLGEGCIVIKKDPKVDGAKFYDIKTSKKHFLQSTWSRKCMLHQR